MKAIEVRDFSISVLHNSNSKAQILTREWFQHNPRFTWINYPYSGSYDCHLTVYKTPEGITPDIEKYSNVLFAITGMGNFQIDLETKKIEASDLFSCIQEICSKIREYTIENKDKFEIPSDLPTPELSPYLIEEVQKFVQKLYK